MLSPRLFILFVIAAASAQADDTQSPPPKAEHIIRAAVDQWRGVSSQSEMTMIIHRPSWERTMTMQAWTKGDERALVRVLEPKKDRGNGTLTEGKIFVCTKPGADVPCPDDGRYVHAEFAGPHPAGLVGTHIHFLDPVSADKTVWHIGLQDVLAFGRLFKLGQLPTKRMVSVGGPMALNPRILRTRMGASVNDILEGEVADGPVRIISGSILSGHRATGPLGYLGRYHRQITCLEESSVREFMHWARLGNKKYSALRAFTGSMFSRKDVNLTTTQNGSLRAIVPIMAFESVMPLDILATPLLKTLVVQDTDRAQQLGALELDEEDLALCSFVCNGKYEYGPALRDNLDEIEANG